MKSKQWFESWFDSPYYHILYNKRDDREAKHFLDNLVSLLQPKSDSKFLDVACGKGRHAIYLNKKGFDVTGIDLSQSSIRHNRKYENKTLSFHVHDMRNDFRKEGFDVAFNLFTSFGYFENPDDNVKTLQAINHNLKPDGILVLDYINSSKAKRNLVVNEDCAKGGIAFKIHRKIAKGYIVKDISFHDSDLKCNYSEKVQMISLKEFKDYFEQSGFSIIHLFGDYQLHPYDEKNSDRLIMIVKKV